MSSVRVAVRVRPLNKREKQLSSRKIIHMEGKRTSIYKPLPVGEDKLGEEGKTFSYDYSYDSSDKTSPTFASQEMIFQDLGSEVLKAAYNGFNACMFAYGQTGSGKSYTMMGDKDDKGLIPRICEGFFLEISERSKSESASFHTEVSYLEIYNERVQDLLKRSPSTDGAGLKVREHPKDGPYVENLSKHVVHNHSNMEELIFLGDANRTKASTGMNDFSSRSHAIFTIKFTQKYFNAELPHETLSKIHLVDLAGSERADATHTTGTRLKEGANINKSLVTLGSVISALADPSVGGQLSKKKQIFVPYRDSVLTWLLKDSLGGNSLTTMIATISPADVNYGETLSTLRYANRAKNIMNSPMVNEDGSVKVIRELRAEVNRLQTLLEEASQGFHGELPTSVKVEEKLCQNEAEAVALTSRCEEMETILQEETVAVRKEGSGVVLDCQLPHLIGIDEDLLSTGIILYYLKEGRTLIGSDEASCSQDIVLHGSGLLREHCVLENHAGTVTLLPQDGALCSVNGSVVKHPQQLTQGSIIQLGNGTKLRFNHPAEATQLREKQAQSKPLSAFNHTLTDLSKSEISSKGMLEKSRSLEDFNHKEEGQTQNLERLTRNDCNNKRLSSGNVVLSNQMKEQSSRFSQMDGLPVESAFKDPRVCLKSKLKKKLMSTAIPRRDCIPCTGSELDRDALQGGVSTRDGREQERDLCHKSGPRLMSEGPQRKAGSGTAVASHKEEEVWSGDASLQQTSVLGPGDGCGMKPEGNANEIQGVVTDCYKRRPGSGGSSLGSMSHLQRSEGGSFMSVLPQTSTHSQFDGEPLNSQTACCPPKDSAFRGPFVSKEMDEPGGLQEIPVVCVTDTSAAMAPNSGLGSLFSRVSWIVQDARRRLWRSPAILQQLTDIRLQPIGSQWSSYVISLVRESNVLSVMKDSQVSSMVRGSFVFSLFRESHIFSVVKELPFIQHIQMNITQHLQPEETAKMIQGCINPDNTRLSAVTPAQTMVEELQGDVQRIPENASRKDWQSPQKQDGVDIHVKQGDENVTASLQSRYISEMDATHVPRRGNQAMGNSKTARIVIQTLIKFPDSLVKLQTLPLQVMTDTLRSIIPTSVFSSQRIVALHWHSVATCSQPEPQPALLILMETGLYALTADFELLVLFHHLPLMQLREMHVGFAGHSLRLMGTEKESILAVYTHSQKHTKELCGAILETICPGDIRISQYPLLHEDLMKISLDCHFSLSDLLLDAGLKVYCRFQKSLADLVYLLHCNMDGEAVTLGEVQLLLYTSVAVHISPGSHSERLAQFFLTDTHLGLVREDAVFHPAPQSISIEARRPQFHDLTLRQSSDVRCILVHDEDKSGSVRLDVILANVRGRGHPESVTKAATPSEHALNSSPHAEVWKLTFSCSTEAACLINHLSNV